MSIEKLKKVLEDSDVSINVVMVSDWRATAIEKYIEYASETGMRITSYDFERLVDRMSETEG